MSVVRRFLTGFGFPDSAQPGLEQHSDGSVWVVMPDGSEVQLGIVTGAGLLLTPVAIQNEDGWTVASFQQNGMAVQLAPGFEGSTTVNVSAIPGQTGGLVEVDGVEGEALIVDEHAKIHAAPGITDLPEPSAESDAATKGYTDSAVAESIPQGGPLAEELVAGGPISDVTAFTVPGAVAVQGSGAGVPFFKLLAGLADEPAPSLLESGETIVWLDGTPFASKMKLMAKDEDGDTVQGEIPLSSQGTSYASYNGDPVTLASFEDKDLPFTNLTTDTDILDRSVIGQPTFLQAGVYVISVLVSAGGGADGPVDIRLFGGDEGVVMFETALTLEVGATLTAPFSVEAGQVVRVFCSNHGTLPIDLVLSGAKFARIGSA